MIPVAIALDPYLKQIAMSEGESFHWNTFDLEFLHAIAYHKKLLP